MLYFGIPICIYLCTCTVVLLLVSLVMANMSGLRVTAPLCLFYIPNAELGEAGFNLH